MAKMPLTAAQLSLKNRAAAYELWARVADPSAHTAPARAKFDDRFAQQVDPDGVLSPEERARRAAYARKAYFARLAARSAQVRGARKAAKAA